MILLDGKKVADKIKQDLKKRVESLKETRGFTPILTVIQVGDDQASSSYIKGKKRGAEEIGIEFNHVHYIEEINTELLKAVIGEECAYSTGVICQLPLPKHINEQEIINRIRIDKDVDGFHPANVGKLMLGMNTTLPCTPKGIIRLLKEYGVELEGKHAVVVGRSNIVGKPISMLLQQENCTVTMCHSRTANLKYHTRQADILIVAVGKQEFINQTHLKHGAVVIDVGIHRKEDGTLTGDVDFASASLKASAISPVPKGVGAMTVAMLLENVVELAEESARKELLL